MYPNVPNVIFFLRCGLPGRCIHLYLNVLYLGSNVSKRVTAALEIFPCWDLGRDPWVGKHWSRMKYTIIIICNKILIIIIHNEKNKIYHLGCLNISVHLSMFYVYSVFLCYTTSLSIILIFIL
jgi:hypothetical protein